MNIQRFQRRGAGDAGETLLEILLAMIILGGAISALLAGLSTGVLGSVAHRNEASANSLLRSYAEAVKQSAKEGYRPCPVSTYPIDVNAYVRPNGWDPPTNVVTCGGTDNGVQKVTITVNAPTGQHETQTLEIWVRKP
jgi:type II secretory pathway pseudopilin PulG